MDSDRVWSATISCSESLLTATRALNDFISPMTNPVFFEDPADVDRSPDHLPRSSAAKCSGGDHVQSGRCSSLALTENLSIIATRTDSSCRTARC